MSSFSRLLCASIGALALAGCERAAPLSTCNLPVVLFGLQVIVVDSLTNTSPPSAILIARSGAYVDSVGPRTPDALGWLSLSAAMERSGMYDLTVRAPGYREWTRADVRVTDDGCHVDPVAVTARLRP